jgi:hypothetical protein
LQQQKKCHSNFFFKKNRDCGGFKLLVKQNKNLRLFRMDANEAAAVCAAVQKTVAKYPADARIYDHSSTVATGYCDSSKPPQNPYKTVANCKFFCSDLVKVF